MLDTYTSWVYILAATGPTIRPALHGGIRENANRTLAKNNKHCQQRCRGVGGSIRRIHSEDPCRCRSKEFRFAIKKQLSVCWPTIIAQLNYRASWERKWAGLYSNHWSPMLMAELPSRWERRWFVFANRRQLLHIRLMPVRGWNLRSALRVQWQARLIRMFGALLLVSTSAIPEKFINYNANF